MKFFLCVVGGVMVIEGLPYFAFPDKMKMWIQKLQEISSDNLQKSGFAVVVMGFFLIYMGIR
jgi:uncharacterized protein YjeT (DUF2065 family)